MAALVALAALLVAPLGAAAATPSAALRIDPAASTVDSGATFTVNIIQNATVATLGAQADLTFDPKIVQVAGIKAGPAYNTGLSLFGSAFDGSTQSVAAAVAKANQTGTVAVVATGKTPAGDAVVVAITMTALQGPGGTSPLDLQNPQMLDQDGAVISVTATAGAVNVRPSAGASGATAVPEPSPSAAASSDDGGGAAATPANATVLVAPASLQVAVGASVAVDLRISTPGQVASVAADLTFDKTLLQVVSVVAGPAWSGAILRAGNGTVDDAIAQANASGVLSQVSVVVPVGSATDQGVDGAFATVTMKGIANGTSDLGLTGVSVQDTQGLSMLVGLTNSQLVVGAGGGSAAGGTGASGPAGSGPGGSGGPSNAQLVALAILALVLFGVVVALFPTSSGGRPGVLLRRWPFAVSLVLGLIPVIMFAGIVAIVVVNSLPAFSDPGLGQLLGDQFIGAYSAQGALQQAYGLLPALAGTILIAAIAMLLALPVSLAMAIVSTEFPMGPVGRVIGLWWVCSLAFRRSSMPCRC